jgi:hypothetical protein
MIYSLLTLTELLKRVATRAAATTRETTSLIGLDTLVIMLRLFLSVACGEFMRGGVKSWLGKKFYFTPLDIVSIDLIRRLSYQNYENKEPKVISFW